MDFIILLLVLHVLLSLLIDFLVIHFYDGEMIYGKDRAETEMNEGDMRYEIWDLSVTTT